MIDSKSLYEAYFNLDNKVDILENKLDDITVLTPSQTTNINKIPSLEEDIDELSSLLENKADIDIVNINKAEVDANLLIIGSHADFSKEKLISFTSFNKPYYLDRNDNTIKCMANTDKLVSWFTMDNINELSFNVLNDSNWVVIGLGLDYSAYCVVVNIKGLATANVAKMTKNGIATTLQSTISREQAVIGDTIYAKINGHIITFYKNDILWFTVDTTLFNDITNIKLGVMRLATVNGFHLCEDFMKLNSLNKPSIIPITLQVESVWKNKTFVSLGDSITWQDGNIYNGTSDIARGYQTIMKEKLGFATYLNKGVSGRPIANGTTSGDGTNTTSKTVNYSTYDLVTIAGGTNDFKLNIPLGSKGVIGDTTFNTNNFYGAYRDMLEYILKAKPNIRICLFTPLQRDNASYDVNYTNSAGHKLIDYVNAIRDIGEMYGLPVCDMYKNSGFTKLTLTTYTIDGLHPNDVGYSRMGGYASKFIDNIGL